MTSPPAPSPSIIAALSAFSTCELSDALIKLGVPHGGHLPDIQRISNYPGCTDERICGPAYTVQMVLANDTTAPKLQHHFVDTIVTGSVVVIDAPARMLSVLCISPIPIVGSVGASEIPVYLLQLYPLEVKNAVWGGLMTAGAQARGAIGAVISGRCRDVAEHALARFPVFARGQSTLGQASFTRASVVQVPLVIQAQPLGNCGGFPAVTVCPGDLVVADADGVVCVPRDRVDVVLSLAGKGREVDKCCMEDIRAGMSVAESFRKHRGK